MGKFARLLLGTLVAALAMYLWLRVASEQAVIAITGTVVIGACAAATLRSRWALVLVPAAVMVGLKTWRATVCPQCASSDDTPFVVFIISLPFYGGSALIEAAIGTALPWHRRRGYVIASNIHWPLSTLRSHTGAIWAEIADFSSGSCSIA